MPNTQRLLIEVMASDGPGNIVGDGRFVLELKDGVGRLIEPLRQFGPGLYLRLDLRVSELLERSERDELIELRRVVRDAAKKTP